MIASMIQMVASGMAIDLSQIEQTPEGWFPLEMWDSEKFYCRLDKQDWIWSIGKETETGKIFASTQMDFFDRPGFECLWLWPLPKNKK